MKRETERQTEEEIGSLVRQRKAVENKLKRVETATKTSAAVKNENLRDIHLLKLQLKNVENGFTAFSKYQSQIFALALNVLLPTFDGSFGSTFDGSSMDQNFWRYDPRVLAFL